MASDDGRRIIGGRYRLLQQVGAGETGAVWRGEDVVLGRTVTVEEVVFPAGASDADPAVVRERILREARAVARLDHPGALPVLDVVDDGPTYLVEQDVPGTRLSALIGRDGALSPQRAALVGLAVLGVLGAAHARGILHRDVKPANVLLSAPEGSSPGRVLLTGFGIVQSVGDTLLAGTGLVIGSPGFTAPEIVRGGAPGPASDLWSLGATLFTAVEGRPPYAGSDVAGTLAAVVSGEHAPYVRAGALQPVLARLLEPDPARRIPAGELEEALGEVAASWTDAGTGPVSPLPGAGVPDVVSRTTVLHAGTPVPVDRTAAPVEPEAPRAAVPRPARSGTAHARHRRPASRRRRVTVALLVGLLAAVLLGGTLALVRAGEEPSPDVVAEQPAQSEQASPPAGGAPVPGGTSLLPPLPADATTPVERLGLTIPALAEVVAGAPDAAGQRAGEVLEDLRRVESLDGAQRRSAAIAADAAVADAVRAGELDAGVGQRVQQVLGDVVRPDRLVDLVAMLEVDPLAAGPGGPELFDQLFALDHRVPADQTAARADALLQAVTAGVEQGRLTEAVERAVVPTLLELADPAPQQALTDLVTRAEEDPDAVGPAAAEVLASLQDMRALPVFELGNQAADLLQLLGGDGRVTPAFRDAAVPVLTALVR
jgi:hypothetical protein